MSSYYGGACGGRESAVPGPEGQGSWAWRSADWETWTAPRKSGGWNGSVPESTANDGGKSTWDGSASSAATGAQPASTPLGGNTWGDQESYSSSWGGTQSWYKSRIPSSRRWEGGDWPGQDECGSNDRQAATNGTVNGSNDRQVATNGTVDNHAICVEVDPLQLQAAQDALEEHLAASAASGTKPEATMFSRAIRLCASHTDGSKALELFDKMKDIHSLEPDAATYLSAIEACETGTQPLERAWFLLDEMRKQGLDPSAAPSALEDGSVSPPSIPGSALTGLRHHLQRWLTADLPENAYGVALQAAGVLKSQRQLSSTVEDLVVQNVLTPIVEALREPASPTSAAAAALHRVAGLGHFTGTVLEQLDLGGFPASWEATAQEELRRQGLLRRWAVWEEQTGPGLLTWIAYDLSGGEAQAAWDLSSNGEVFGRSTDTLGDASLVMLPPLSHGADTGHAERRALLALVSRIFEKFPSGSSGGQKVEGIVLLYSPQPPSISGIYAIRQCLQLFPWIRFAVGFGNGQRQEAPPEQIGEPLRVENGRSWGKWSSWKDGGSWSSHEKSQTIVASGGNGVDYIGEAKAAAEANTTDGRSQSNGGGSWSRWV